MIVSVKIYYHLTKKTKTIKNNIKKELKKSVVLCCSQQLLATTIKKHKIMFFSETAAATTIKHSCSIDLLFVLILICFCVFVKKNKLVVDEDYSTRYSSFFCCICS